MHKGLRMLRFQGTPARQEHDDGGGRMSDASNLAAWILFVFTRPTDRALDGWCVGPWTSYEIAATEGAA